MKKQLGEGNAPPEGLRSTEEARKAHRELVQLLPSWGSSAGPAASAEGKLARRRAKPCLVAA